MEKVIKICLIILIAFILVMVGGLSYNLLRDMKLEWYSIIFFILSTGLLIIPALSFWVYLFSEKIFKL